MPSGGSPDGTSLQHTRVRPIALCGRLFGNNYPGSLAMHTVSSPELRQRDSHHVFTKALPREPFVSKVRTCSARRLRGYGGGPPQQVATPGPFLQPIPVLCRDLGVPRAGPFFGLQRVGPETTLQWRNVSPMMLVMLAWRRPMMLLMLSRRR